MADPIRPHILLTRRWPDEVVCRLHERYEVVMDEEDRPLERALLDDALKRFDAVCPTVTDRIDAGLLAGARTRILANYGAGFEHIDIEAARRRGIIVTNTPDVLTEATAELAILLMLGAARRAREGWEQLRLGTWPGWSPGHLVGSGLDGRSLGLVGFGRIGRAVARRAHFGLGMRISYFARTAGDDAFSRAVGAHHQGNLDALLAQSDVVSLHCPGGPATRHLVDAHRLALMKPGSILINTARGSVVDEVALVAALRQGRPAAAGLDVYEDEPRVSRPLVECPNAFLLPHLGSATRDARVAMGMRAADNLDRFFAGGEPADRVA
jgi:lactate dehydrogenase-like 2-hydroxyacid dehydrogenase